MRRMGMLSKFYLVSYLSEGRRAGTLGGGNDELQSETDYVDL